MVHTCICLCLCGRLDCWISPKRLGLGSGPVRLVYACATALVAHSKVNLIDPATSAQKCIAA